MRKSLVIAFISIASWCLAACSTIPVGSTEACVGDVMEPPPGLVETVNTALLAESLGAAGEGKLCAGKVFKVTYPFSVYRVWDSANTSSAYGRWWSFSPPQGPRESYREANEICTSWSALDRLSVCTLKIGAFIVIGPGQSAKCTDASYAKSAVNQVYVQNDAKNKQYDVENCISSDKWPSASH